MNVAWDCYGEADRVTGASPPTPHLSALLRKMAMGVLKGQRGSRYVCAEKLCVPVRLPTGIPMSFHLWRAGCACHTV